MFGFNPLYAACVLALGGLQPAFSLDFLADGLPSSVTFSRPSNATMFDDQGRLVWAPTNWLTRGNNFLSNWTLGADGTVTPEYSTAPSGRPSALVTWTVASPTGGLTASTNPVVVGCPLKYQIKIRRINWDICRVTMYSQANAANALRVWVDLASKQLLTEQAGGTASYSGGDITELAGGWVQVTISGSLPFTGATDLSVLVATAPSDGNTARVGNGAALEIAEAVVCPYNPFDNLADNLFASDDFSTEGSAYYGPRFDRDPLTLELLGLRVEEQRTNLQPISLGTPANWTANTGSMTDTGATICGQKALTFTTSAALPSQFAFMSAQPLALAANTRHTASIFVKRGNHPRVQFTTTNNSFQPLVADALINYNFDTDTLTVLGSSLPAPTGDRILCADGSVQLRLSFSSGTAPIGGASCIIAFADSDNANRLTATATIGATVHIYGLQLENQAAGSSHIPTFGTAATRSGEIPVADGASWALAQAAAAMVIDVSTTYARAAAGSIGYAQLDDGTTANRIAIRAAVTTGTSQATFVVAGVVTYNTSTSPAGFGPSKYALSWDNTLFSMAKNGAVSMDSIAHGGRPTALTRITLGGAGGLGSLTFGGCIRSLRGYSLPSRFTAAELQALTA